MTKVKPIGKLGWWILTTAAFACTTVNAQQIDKDAAEALTKMVLGTIYVVAHRTTADGALQSCGLEFDVIGRDHATKRGAGVGVAGSYYLYRTGDRLGYVVKLGITDKVGQPMQAKTAPANAFVAAVRGDGPKIKPIRQESDTSDYALFVGGVDPDAATKLLNSMFEKKRMVVGFNRQAGQQDVRLEIDLTVKDSEVKNGKVVREHSDDMLNDFSACLGDLLSGT